MQGYNLIAVYNKSMDRWLMCRRKKEPYLGLSNLVGGKIELGEDGIDAAYRELEEETSIRREDINLTHLMDFTYPLDDCYVEVYVGRLKREVTVEGDENPLYWSDFGHDFFDSAQYAGERNIGHILEHIELKKLFLLQLPDALERWNLKQCTPIYERNTKAVYEAVSPEFGPVILKINSDVNQLREEYVMLQALAGSGCCKLYAYDEEAGWLLEERLTPGTVLRQEPSLEIRIQKFAQVFRQIHHRNVTEGQFPDYMQWLDKIYDFCINHKADSRMAEQAALAREICMEMFEKYPKRVLLHGDLHHDNLLLREDGTYGIIDPKGVIGPEILDVARYLMNEIDTQYEEPAEEHIYEAACQISQILNYPLEDVIKVHFMEVILGNVWYMEDNEPINEEEIEVASKLLKRSRSCVKSK